MQKLICLNVLGLEIGGVWGPVRKVAWPPSERKVLVYMSPALRGYNVHEGLDKTGNIVAHSEIYVYVVPSPGRTERRLQNRALN